MCLITEQKSAKILKEGLRVKKIVKLINSKEAESAYYRFYYELGKVYKTKMPITHTPFEFFGWAVYDAYPDWDYNPDYIHIHEGFHTMTLDRYTETKNPLVECIIPKGSRVFYDKTGLIASNQIIIVGEYHSEPVKIKKYI